MTAADVCVFFPAKNFPSCVATISQSPGAYQVVVVVVDTVGIIAFACSKDCSVNPALCKAVRAVFEAISSDEGVVAAGEDVLPTIF